MPFRRSIRTTRLAVRVSWNVAAGSPRPPILTASEESVSSSENARWALVVMLRTLHWRHLVEEDRPRREPADSVSSD